jgi:hypothetical protein
VRKRGELPQKAALRSERSDTVHCRVAPTTQERKSKSNLHEVSLEEGLQLPLGGRVREVSDVESSSLRGAGQDRIVLGGLVGGGRLVGDRCVAKSGSNVVDGVRKLLHDSRHDGELRGCGLG